MLAVVLRRSTGDTHLYSFRTKSLELFALAAMGSILTVELDAGVREKNVRAKEVYCKLPGGCLAVWFDVGLGTTPSWS